MKTFPYSIACLVLYILVALPALAQITDPETEGIRATRTDYIEGRNKGDLTQLWKAFHQEATRKFIHPETKLTPGQKQNCTAEILDFKLYADAAQATVLLRYPQLTYYDYMNLLKVNGKWVISDKIFSRKPTVN